MVPPRCVDIMPRGAIIRLHNELRRLGEVGKKRQG